MTWGRRLYRIRNSLYVREPARLLRDVRSVAAGEEHYLAMTRDGRVVAWGDNSVRQCNVPSDLPPVEAVAAGHHHSLAVTTDGRVVAWGHNNYGQINVPPDLPPVVAVAANCTCSFALTADGDVVAWCSICSLKVPSGLKAVAVSASSSHALAVTPEGRVVAWGSNNCGQCNVPRDLSPVVAAAAGMGYSVALTVTGDVVAWGMPWFAYDVLSGLKAVAVAVYGVPLLTVTPEGRVVVWSYDAGDPQCAVPPGLTVRVAPSGTPAANT